MTSGMGIAVLVAGLLGLVFTGVHIAVALGIASIGGIVLLTGDLAVARQFVGGMAYEALRDYIFAVIPLFMLMGEFLARCGAARDMYNLVTRLTRLVPARLGVATVLANAVFAFVTGVSMAAAAAFSRVAYPEMKRAGYSRRFALGCISGSACLGMLIPPSVLMIVWGVLTEQSIGKLFLAGVIPGFMLVAYFVLYILFVGLTRPEQVGEVRGRPIPAAAEMPALPAGVLASTLLVVALVLGILVGIGLGLFTPTVGAGVGAAAALLVAVAKGLRAREVMEVVLAVGRMSGPLLLLLFAAQMYSRVLSMTGVTQAVQDLIAGSGLPSYAILALMVAIWFVLGCIIDSISIILLTLPVFSPIAMSAGFDPLAFAIIGIMAIETGMLTPPFGLLAFTVQAALPEEKGVVSEVFRGAIPYWVGLLAIILLVWLLPATATWLPAAAFAAK